MDVGARGVRLAWARITWFPQRSLISISSVEDDCEILRVMRTSEKLRSVRLGVQSCWLQALLGFLTVLIQQPGTFGNLNIQEILSWPRRMS